VDIVNGCLGQANNDFQRGTSWRKPWRQSRQQIPAEILIEIDFDENPGWKSKQKS